MASEISKSIQYICDEKGLEYSEVLEALEVALAAAYRKGFGNKQQNLIVKFDPETADMQVWDVKTVVEDIDEEKLEQDQEELTARREQARAEGREFTEEDMDDLLRFNPKTDIMISDAKKIKKDAKVGDILQMEQTIPGDFGRMAAQTAKQVIIQKLREAERNSVFEDFKDKQGEIIQGIVQKRERNGMMIVDFGKINGILMPEEQIRREQYRPGMRLQFYILSVAVGDRGPEIYLSRASTKMVTTLFTQEIPEISDGSVVIKGIARDAGNRTKIAVSTDDESIDPIGACIGQRGNRITTIIELLDGEKIDVIQHKTDIKEYIKEALSPAKISEVELHEEEKEAVVKVADDQFSLAIGRNGQNVRLASELVGWKIDVVESETDSTSEKEEEKTEEEQIEDVKEEKQESEA